LTDTLMSADDLPPTILLGRFLLLNEIRSGGMATVQKAVDLTSGKFAGIKRMKSGGDQQRLSLSFQREVEALQRLNHPNIVTLLAVDQDTDGRWFLAMEWIERNLEAYILENGAMSWTEFFKTVGEPLLGAVEYAQSHHELVHRDINPRNILVADGDVPKIADYGISKVLGDRDAWMPAAGRTLIDARTPGFSPKEADDRQYSRSRDCFSLAAVAVACLVGRSFGGDEDLSIAIQEAPLPEHVRPYLETVLSDDPRRRPYDAEAMRSELQRIEDIRHFAKPDAIQCYLDISPATESRLQGRFDRSRAEVEKFILNELDEACALALQRGSDGTINPDKLELIGVSWRFRCVIGGRFSERLQIIDAYEIDAARAGKLRETGCRIALNLSFGRPVDAATASDALKELWSDVAAHEGRRDHARVALNSERIFKAWKGYLRDRQDIELHRSNVIHYTRRRIQKNLVIFTADLAPSSEVVDQDRFVRVGGRHVFGRITRVVLDQVTFEVTRGDPELLPQKGELLLNTVAAERAIGYQNSALDSVIYDRTANRRLRSILLDPACAKPPAAIEPDAVKGSALRGEKLGVLRQALGTNEMLAIEGPPGTSKTDLISEIAVNWLARNPGHRILLSSQTHTALDEAIERIIKLQGNDSSDIVRIGRPDDIRIGAISKPLVLERKVEHWANLVRQRAETNLQTWAEGRGVDRGLVSLGMKVERLVLILRQMQDLRGHIASQEAEAQGAEEKLEEQNNTPDESEELSTTTIEIGDDITALRAALRNLKNLEKLVRAELALGPDLGPDLAKMTNITELEEWQSVYLNGDVRVKECQQRLSLLEQWLLRVGRTGDFNAAVLNDAKVIAATCVGIAGVKGIEEVEYDLCIVDEASKATATEILIPMSRSRRWIIVGDPKQLPPFFETFGAELLSEFDELDDIRPTILDRMIDRAAGLPESCRAMLKEQHRMIQPIGDLVSHCFYDDQLQSPIVSHGLNLHPHIPAPVTWFTTSRHPRRGDRKVDKTFENSLEVDWTKEVLNRLQAAAAQQGREISVAVIAGYIAQVKKLVEMTDRNASDWPALKILCNSVDAFQGKQADVCIYSVTRSNNERKLGFLKEPPRLNVALSRAKSSLILVGDHHFCSTARGQNPFKPVIDWIEGHSLNCHIGLVS
tara:strand:+ start:2049 stop:5516 length:3468 start_codon:yes stop_codon:yes gene_type:complete